MNNLELADLLEEQIDLSEYFLKAFLKLYKENEKEDIKPEQYVKNIEIMLQIAKQFI